MTWFSFLGKKSSDFGIVVEKYSDFYIPIKSFEKINIAGSDKVEYRAGSYDPVTLSFECYIKDKSPSKIREVSKWLNSGLEGKLIRGDDSEFFYNAKVVNAIPVSKVARKFSKFIIQFECEPFAYAVKDEVITVIEKSITLENKGAVISKPAYKVYGEEVTISVNGKSFTVYSINDYVVIDTDLMECYKDNNSMNTNSRGNYVDLWLQVGTNNIQVSGATRLEITPNWRY